MCGIVAYSGNSKFNKNKIQTLLMYNEHRGEEASGFYNNDPEVAFAARIQKHLGKVSKSLAKNYSLEETDCFIGHVRKKSTGINDVKSAHPFLEGKYIGVHNGTFKNWKDVVEAFELNTSEYDVDSKVLYKMLSDTDNLQKALGYFEGGAAIVCTSEDQPNTINVYRNIDRPLYRGTCKDGEGSKGIYLSSIEDGLHAIGCTNVQEVSPGKVYTIAAGEVSCSQKKIVKQDLPKVPDTLLEMVSDVRIIKEISKPTEFKKQDVPDQSTHAAHYTTFTNVQYDDGTVGTTTHNSGWMSEVKKIQLVFCDIRKAYYNRYYYGHSNTTIKMFEVALDPNFVPDESENISDGISALLYTIYGEISGTQLALLDDKSNITEEEVADQLQSAISKMEMFLGIFTE